MRVAFIGNIRAGKTTAAKHLVDEYGFYRLSFARHLKHITVEMLEEMRRYIGRPEFFTLERLEQEKTKPAIRKLLQFVGTDLGREYFGPASLWVDLTIAELDTVHDFVIDDCRFLNEAEALKKEGFTFVRITRPEEERMRELRELYGQERTTEIVSHASETELQDYPADITIQATTVAELHQQLDRIMKETNVLH